MIEILFEDDWLLAANKFSGIPIHQTIDKFRPHFQGQLEKQMGIPLVLYHRLDADTSGVVLFGKKKEANRAMTDLFRNREIQKTYDVVVEGAWPPTLTEVSGYLKETPEKKGKYFLDSKGNHTEKSLTHFSLVDTFKKKHTRSHIQASPKTGRTHQIRVHCASSGFPICGDKLYGNPDKQGVPMALHARVLEFAHPVVADANLRIEAPLPKSWAHWISS